MWTDVVGCWRVGRVGRKESREQRAEKREQRAEKRAERKREKEIDGARGRKEDGESRKKRWGKEGGGRSN